MPAEPRIPGPDHPITVEPLPSRVTVRAGGHSIADTTAALVLRESAYRPVYYLPLDALDRTRLRRSDTTTYCPYKGEATYYHVITESGEIADALWTYERPYPAMAAIAGHVACYADRVEIDIAEAA